MATKAKLSKFGRLKQFTAPRTTDVPPLVPITIAGESRNLRFDMMAVGRLEQSLNQDVIEILKYLSGAASGARFSVRVLLAVIAAGIAHEYEPGYAPEWDDLGQHVSNLNELTPLIKPALDALTGALVNPAETPGPEGEPGEDPNAQKPAEGSTGPASSNSPATSSV